MNRFAGAESFAQITQWFDQPSMGGQLEPERAQQLENIIDKVDCTVTATRNSIDSLPVAMQRDPLSI